MSQVDRIVAPRLGRHRILLRKNKAHDLTQLDVLKEELNMHWIRRVFGWHVIFIFDKVILGQHLYVRVVRVDGDWPSKRNRNRAISCEESPPNALPQPLIGFAQLRVLHTNQLSAASSEAIIPELLSQSDSPPMHARALSNDDGNSAPVENIFGDIWTVSERSRDMKRR